jgi:hypothetical protein
MLGCGYQFETIFPRDTQEAGEDQGKLIIPRSPLAFILTIVVDYTRHKQFKLQVL